MLLNTVGQRLRRTSHNANRNNFEEAGPTSQFHFEPRRPDTEEGKSVETLTEGISHPRRQPEHTRRTGHPSIEGISGSKGDESENGGGIRKCFNLITQLLQGDGGIRTSTPKG